jgi:hypothetical protein
VVELNPDLMAVDVYPAVEDIAQIDGVLHPSREHVFSA